MEFDVLKFSEDELNPLTIRSRDIYLKQDAETIKKLNHLFNAPAKEYQLKLIKRSRSEPAEGDIFILSPRESVYFYGRVLKTNIQHIKQDIFIHGKSVVVIFKSKSKVQTLENYRADYDNLLINPEIVDKSYWSQGFFHTIGNEPLSESEKELDIGFYSIAKRRYYLETGVEIHREPNLMGAYGIATITGIARQVNKELIINPKLLEF